MLRFAAQRSGVRRSAKEPRSIAAAAVRLLLSLFRRERKAR
jgi:hypothetical protein